jgi:hypothetical protein
LVKKGFREVSSTRPEPDNDPARRTLAAFKRCEDDFSVSLSLDDDPMFWIRLEKDQPAGTALVTDFKAGVQSDNAMAFGLAAVLTGLPGDGALDVVFHDLVPGDHDPSRYRVELSQVSQAIQSWAEAAGRLMGKELGDVRMEVVRGKARLVARLS